MPLNNGAYRAITDKIALQQLTIPAYIPNPNLGIETAEQTQPFGLILYSDDSQPKIRCRYSKSFSGSNRRSCSKFSRKSG